jgi:hypothetical protein
MSIQEVWELCSFFSHVNKKFVAGHWVEESKTMKCWSEWVKGQMDWFLPCLPDPSLSACTYRNQECRLTIHYDNGFSISTEPQDGAFPKTIIQSPYEKLKMSSDDGIRMLYLDFGGKEGEIVSVLFLGPHDFICCIMHCMCNDLEVVGGLTTYSTQSTDSTVVGGSCCSRSLRKQDWILGLQTDPVISSSFFWFHFSLENDINIWIQRKNLL